MNENLNLVEILKDCHEGTKLYSTIYGKVEFDKIYKDKYYPISIKVNPTFFAKVTSDGRHVSHFDGECTLFPSKEQRDWSKFKVKKPMFEPKTLQPFDMEIKNMTQEDKELLLKDLCARLPYEVVGKCEIDDSYDTSFDTKFQTHIFDAMVYGLEEDLLLVNPLIEDRDEQEFANEEVADGVDIFDFKPYLFPMSSMTEEQKKEYNLLRNRVDKELYDTWKSIDYLNTHHFDYRGLIDKGLSIDATGLNIY